MNPASRCYGAGQLGAGGPVSRGWWTTQPAPAPKAVTTPLTGDTMFLLVQRKKRQHFGSAGRARILHHRRSLRDSRSGKLRRARLCCIRFAATPTRASAVTSPISARRLEP